MTSFTVNGQPVHYRMDPRDAPALGAAGRVQPHRHQVRLRHRPLRRLHGPCRRQCGPLLPRPDRPARGQLRHHHRGPVARPLAPGPAGLRRRHGPAMRLLHSGHRSWPPRRSIDRNDSPTDDQIDAAIPNLCRCGIYPRLRESIRRAVRIKTGREQVEGAPPPGVNPAEAARAVPALRPEPERRRRPRPLISFRLAFRPVQQPLIRFAAQCSPSRGASAAGTIRS